MSVSEANSLYRIATAAKTLEWVKANQNPSSLLYKEEKACYMEMTDALNEIDWTGFDPRASLEYYMRAK